MEASDTRISDHRFKLSDGRDVGITIYEGKIPGRGMGPILYDARIDGSPVEIGRSVLIHKGQTGWNEKDIETHIRKEYDTAQQPAPCGL